MSRELVWGTRAKQEGNRNRGAVPKKQEAIKTKRVRGYVKGRLTWIPADRSLMDVFSAVLGWNNCTRDGPTSDDGWVARVLTSSIASSSAFVRFLKRSRRQLSTTPLTAWKRLREAQRR